jgi:hypothetical protein
MPNPIYGRLALFMLSIVIFMLGYFLINSGLGERELTNTFHQTGVKTEATLVGYKYIKTRSYPGDRPVFTYMTRDGIQRRHIAYEYGLATNIHKKALSTQRVIITYLPSNPDIARVEKWDKGSKGIFDTTMGVFICLLGVLAVFEGLRMPLSPTYK